MEGKGTAMITSMTGYGRRQGTWQGGTVTAEVRSVNHRFLETSIRVPKPMGALEELFKKAIQQQCLRGRVDLTISLQGGRGARTLQLDADLAKQYHQALRTLQRTLKLKGSIDVGLVAGLRDVIGVSEQPADEPKLAKFAEKLGRLALDDLTAMRKQEGVLLARDIVSRLDTLRRSKALIAERAPAVSAEIFERMKVRVEKLLGEAVPDVPRLNQELASFADRCDITEELVRLDAHMIQFERTVHSAESVGKTLDFILQEMGREVNTIGSKANDAAITASVVQMKAELERIREQIQNVE